MAKHRQNRLYDALDDVVKDEKSPFFNKMSEVYDESDDIACYLTNLTKAVVKDDKPVHIGVAILQWSKLLFLRLVMVTNICDQHLSPTFVTNIYFQVHVLVGRPFRRRKFQDLLFRHR